MSKTNSSGYQVTKMTEHKLREEISKIESSEVKSRYTLPTSFEMQAFADTYKSRVLARNLQNVMNIIRGAADEGKYGTCIYSFDDDMGEIENPDIITDVLMDHGYSVTLSHAELGSWVMFVSWEA